MYKFAARALVPSLISFLALFFSAAAATAQTAGASKGDYMYVKLTTDQGEIILALDAQAAPATTANFIDYVKAGHYDGTIFHRVIPGFMIQGGGLDAEMKERPVRPPIKNEAANGLLNDRYAVAMARTPDPHSATSQFFINTQKNDFLNFSSETPSGWGYAVFGQVVEGSKIVDAIEKTPTASRSSHENVPVKPIVIQKAEVLDDYAPAAAKASGSADR